MKNNGGRSLRGTLLEALQRYFMEGKLYDYLKELSSENLREIFLELLEMYANDRNSSTLREIISLTLAGYNYKDKKHGYNGYKSEAGKEIYCEIKPQNTDRENKITHPKDSPNIQEQISKLC